MAQRRSRPRNIRLRVSILYWRCALGGKSKTRTLQRMFQFSIGDAERATGGGRRHMPKVVSILYWRCQPTDAEDSVYVEQSGFNSLLEMPALVQEPRGTLAVPVSILYWRCPHPLTAALAVAAAALWFQFSIGDACCGEVWLCERLRGPQFQFSIGDAQPLTPSRLYDVLRSVSILYWRCIDVEPGGILANFTCTCFNSLLEMPSARAPVSAPAGSRRRFNSLLEMRPTCRSKYCTKSSSRVSILYWRCVLTLKRR